MVTKKDKFLSAAQKLLERGSLDKALLEYQKAAQEDAKDTRTWLKIAEVHVRRGAKQDAIDVYLKTADLYTEQGFFQRAIAVYKNILKLSPGFVQAHFKLADLFKQLGLLSDAMQQFDSAAQSYMRAGRMNEALAALRQIVELNPEHTASRIKLAEAASQAGLAAEAAREFRYACEQFKAQGKMDDYLRVGERLLSHEPENHELARELAALYLERSNPRFALTKLQPLFVPDNTDAATLLLLSQAFEQLGQGVKTLSVLRELAKVLVDARRWNELLDAYRRIAQLDPADAEAKEGIARLEARASHAAGANAPSPAGRSRAPTGPAPITFSEMAIPQFLLNKDPTGAIPLPGMPATARQVSLPAPVSGDRGQDSAGALARSREEKLAEIQRITAECDVFIKYGLLERAALHFQKVFAIDPNNVPVRERLAEVLLELGRSDEAVQEFQTLAASVRARDPAAAAGYERRAAAAQPSAGEFDGPEHGAPHNALGAHPSALAPANSEESGELLDFDTLDAELLEDDDGEADEFAAPAKPVRARSELSGTIDIDLDQPQTNTTGSGLSPFGAAPSTRSEFDRVPRTLQEGMSEVALAADLEQVDFFLHQGMPDDAQSLLDDLLVRYPGHPEILQRQSRLSALVEQGATPSAPLIGGARPAREPATPTPAPRAVVSAGGAADPSTHGDLGIAYKEMGLFDAAINEFRMLSQDAPREVFALTMMGECFEAKGSLADAVIQFKKALNRPSVTDGEATQLYYLLGKVFESLGDRKEALYFFEKVQKRDPGFRDVPERLAKLRGQRPPDPVPTASREPDSLALNSAFDALLGRKKS